MTEVYYTFFVHKPGSKLPKPLPLPPDPDKVFVLDPLCLKARDYVKIGNVLPEYKEEFERSPADGRVAVIRESRSTIWSCVSPAPFFLLYPGGKIKIANPWSHEKLAKVLDTRTIFKLKGKIPEEIYSGLLAAKLRET
jgi:hypothetical protein